MKIVWNYHLAHEFPEAIEKLRHDFPNHEIVVADDRPAFRSELPTAEIIVCGALSDDEFARATRLKVHLLPFTGANSLPLHEYRDRGIAVGNSHGNAAAVAERAVALALAVAGRVVEFHNDLSHGEWHRRNEKGQIFDYWHSIHGSNVTIVGTGAIGRSIARLLGGFGTSITGVRRTQRPLRDGNSDEESSLFDHLSTDLPAALRTARLVFLAVPLTPGTRGLIGLEELREMRGAFLINVSRGEIVDEPSLYETLLDGTLAGAGLDTWWRYPDQLVSPQLPSHLPIHTLKNVVMSPHAASHSESGKVGQLENTLANIRSYLTSRTLAYPVDLTDGY